MTERESALATLSAIASSPDAVAESPAHLAAAMDALVAVYGSTDREGMTDRQRAARSPRAVWASVLTHAEHRLHSLNRAADAVNQPPDPSEVAA